MIKKVKIKNIEENIKPNFIKTSLVTVEREDGKNIKWEVAKSFGSVHILVNNIETKEIMLVKQVRIPVIFNNIGNNGICLECCAGLKDKNCSPEQTAKEELEEEMGISVDVTRIMSSRTLYGGVGITGSKLSCYKVNITNKDIIGLGGGIDDEDIEIESIPYKSIPDLIYGYNEFKNVNLDSTTLFMVSEWFLSNINNL